MLANVVRHRASRTAPNRCGSVRWNIDCAAADFLARVLGSAEEVAAIGGRSVGDVALAGASAFGVGLPRVLRQPRDGPWGQ